MVILGIGYYYFEEMFFYFVSCYFEKLFVNIIFDLRLV